MYGLWNRNRGRVRRAALDTRGIHAGDVILVGLAGLDVSVCVASLRRRVHDRKGSRTSRAVNVVAGDRDAGACWCVPAQRYLVGIACSAQPNRHRRIRGRIARDG